MICVISKVLTAYNSKRTKTHNDTGQTNKYSTQKDTNDRSYPCFCHKITLYYVRKAHTLSLPLSLTHRRTVCTHVKGAVCRILTLLKHKNTIICLHIFKKHAKLTYLFIWKTMLQSVILLWKCVFRPGMSVFVMVCETRPLPVYPIVFRHPGLPVGGKHSVFHFIHHYVRTFLLVSLIWHPARASSLRRRGWWKKPSPIFWIWTAIPSQSYIQHL